MTRFGKSPADSPADSPANSLAQQLIAGQPILLIDDVMTTGATLHEAARCLKKAGAGQVDALVFARVG